MLFVCRKNSNFVQTKSRHGFQTEIQVQRNIYYKQDFNNNRGDVTVRLQFHEALQRVSI